LDENQPKLVAQTLVPPVDALNGTESTMGALSDAELRPYRTRQCRGIHDGSGRASAHAGNFLNSAHDEFLLLLSFSCGGAALCTSRGDSGLLQGVSGRKK
jgi:hypothetical protein